MRTFLALAATAVSVLAVGACSSPPTQEEQRAAGMALAAERMTGQSLGRCLAEKGYEVDADTVASDVQRGTDVELRSGSQKAYIVTVGGPEDVKLPVLYDKAWVLPNTDKDKVLLEQMHCDLP
ncbi:MAG TPA: hypothetical protein PLQ63_13410 [Propionicimonas sp.]|nr:hypothetical protein [Propionicimonas sp.]